MKNHYSINFDKNIIVDNFNQDDYRIPDKGWVTHKISEKRDILSPEMINFLSLLDIPLFINLFYGPPSTITNIHIDMHRSGWALNYAWGSSNSVMKWYSVKKNNVPKLRRTTANTPYFVYDTDDVEVIEETEIKGLCLVRTNVPHSVHNYSNDQGRFCLSIRSDVNYANLSNILEKLSSYVVHN
jgi:hypothetical protein